MYLDIHGEIQYVTRKALPHECILDIQNTVRIRGPAYIIFTCPVQESIGGKLTKLIKQERLGTVWASKPTRNPNSGYSLQVFVWYVNVERTIRWNPKDAKHPI